MKFSPSAVIGSSRQGVIRDITAEEIEEIFGFAPNVDDDPYKVVHSWAVDVSEVPEPVRVDTWGILAMPPVDTWTIHVWDYKGSHEFGQFSVCGNPFILEMIFGQRYESEGFGNRVPDWVDHLGRLRADP